MFREVLLFLVSILLFGILLAAFMWYLFKIPSPFSKPIDCMPRIISGDEKEVKPDLWEKLLGTTCVTD